MWGRRGCNKAIVIHQKTREKERELCITHSSTQLKCSRERGAWDSSSTRKKIVSVMSLRARFLLPLKHLLAYLFSGFQHSFLSINQSHTLQACPHPPLFPLAVSPFSPFPLKQQQCAAVVLLPAKVQSHSHRKQHSSSL